MDVDRGAAPALQILSQAAGDEGEGALTLFTALIQGKRKVKAFLKFPKSGAFQSQSVVPCALLRQGNIDVALYNAVLGACVQSAGRGPQGSQKHLFDSPRELWSKLMLQIIGDARGMVMSCAFYLEFFLSFRFGIPTTGGMTIDVTSFVHGTTRAFHLSLDTTRGCSSQLL